MSYPAYNLSDGIALATQSVLASGQSVITAPNIRITRGDTPAAASRIDIDVGNVSRASEQMAKSAGAWIYVHYQADIEIAVCTDRADSTSASYHDDAVQAVRYLMSREAQSFNSSTLTAFEVLSLEATGETHDTREETREDHTRLTFRMQVGIIPAS